MTLRGWEILSYVRKQLESQLAASPELRHLSLLQ